MVMQLPDIRHCFRVAALSKVLCNQMGICSKIREEIYISAVLHDIGKSMINMEILNKERPLEPREWHEMKNHAELGGMIAANMGHPPSIIKNIVYHHENYDGSGYPRRLKGNEIALGAQIIRICDTYDALRMQRPYKRAFNHDEALREMLREKEKYNPKLLIAFRQLEFNKINGYRENDILSDLGR